MVNPWTVTSPQRRLKALRVIHHAVDWSLAIGIWDGSRVLLVRWNGDARQSMGNPVSHANPTWFVLPHDFRDLILNNLVANPNQMSAREWLTGAEPSEWVDPISN
jgi:hypothetical protein